MSEEKKEVVEAEDHADTKVIKDFDGTGTELRVGDNISEKDTTEKPKLEEIDDGTGTLLYKGTKSTADTVSKKDTADPDAVEDTVEDEPADGLEDKTKAELVEAAKAKGIGEKDAKAKSKDELIEELRK